jgi:predicted nucleic acid-binding protein
MTLTDTGPLVALLDTDDPYHTACVAAAHRLPAGPLLTTWVCFTEAMYLLGAVGGYRYQAALWYLRTTGRLVLHDLSPTEADRMTILMAQYQDTPMDLADASFIVVAESRGLRRIFTTDTDFYVYRLADGSALEVIPQRSRLPTPS